MEQSFVELNRAFFEATRNIDVFVKLATSETQISFLEFRADLQVLFSGLIRLWHQFGLQASFCKDKARIFENARRALLKALVDCTKREDQCAKYPLLEWDQILQEETLRKDIVEIFRELSEILGDAGEKLKLTSPTLNGHNYFSVSTGGIT